MAREVKTKIIGTEVMFVGKGRIERQKISPLAIEEIQALGRQARKDGVKGPTMRIELFKKPFNADILAPYDITQENE